MQVYMHGGETANATAALRSAYPHTHANTLLDPTRESHHSHHRFTGNKPYKRVGHRLTARTWQQLTPTLTSSSNKKQKTKPNQPCDFCALFFYFHSQRRAVKLVPGAL